jgi:Rrf2 family iron-sulfur cluster assembly transcriptional regulator
MQLTTKGRYAVMAMTDLASHGAERPVALAEIAARQDISLAYLEQLFARLRRAGLVSSVRGPGGGYRLTKSAALTPIANIVVAADEPLHATRCGPPGGGEHGCMPGGARCLTHGLWEALGQEIQGFLARVSLQDVLDRRFDPPAPAEAA